MKSVTLLCVVVLLASLVAAVPVESAPKKPPCSKPRCPYKDTGKIANGCPVYECVLPTVDDLGKPAAKVSKA